MKLFYQLLKFGIVGVLNTCITLVGIYVFYSCLSFNYAFANALGFLMGFVSSFLLNRSWTFHATGRKCVESVFFVFVFIISYLFQLSVFMILSKVADVDILISQLLSMVCFTLMNFFGHRYFTFRSRMIMDIFN